MFVEYMISYKKQPKLTFDEFTAFVQRSHAWCKYSCRSKMQQGVDERIVIWLDFHPGENCIDCHLSDKSSIQEAINEFIRAYGPIEEVFSKDLFDTGSSLGFLLHETLNKANFKQLGLAH